MKKFTVKASALAIAAALPGLANAVVDLDVTPTGSLTYASELVTAGVTPVTVVAGVQSQLGFGVSQNQDRYIRYDLSNAKFQAALTAANLEVSNDVCANATVAGDAVETVVQGGTANSTSVIFQITANTAAGLAPTASCVELASGNLGVILNSTTASATIAYSLYETAADAVAGGSAGRLSYKSGTLAGVAPGLKFVTSENTTTADVSTGYKKFTSGTAADGATGVQALIGNVTLGTNAGVKDLTGAADVTFAQLITAANLVVTGPDFSASLGANNGVYLDDLTTCNDAAATAPGIASSSTTRTIAANTGSAGLGICFTAGTTAAIAAQDFTVSLDVITAAAGSAAADQSAIALGAFDRDGTILKAPIMTGAAGQSTFVQLANVGNVDAPYTVRCFAPSGATSAGAPGTVTAGNTKKLFFNNLACAAGSNAAEFTFAVPSGNVVGTLVRQSTTTGDSALDSLTGNK